MNSPGVAHIFFIPGVLLIGMVIGYVMGTRAARATLNELASARVDDASLVGRNFYSFRGVQGRSHRSLHVPGVAFPPCSTSNPRKRSAD